MCTWPPSGMPQTEVMSLPLAKHLYDYVGKQIVSGSLAAQGA